MGAFHIVCARTRLRNKKATEGVASIRQVLSADNIVGEHSICSRKTGGYSARFARYKFALQTYSVLRIRPYGVSHVLKAKQWEPPAYG